LITTPAAGPPFRRDTPGSSREEGDRASRAGRGNLTAARS
jgi:hypothetical protein